MSFIDKLREESHKKNSAAEKPNEAGRLQPDSGPEGTGQSGGAGVAVPPEEILYRHTRTIPVDLAILQQNRLIIGGDNPLISESYKHLRTQILHKTLEGRRNTIMVTSALPDEGKSLTTINLAISLSQELAQTVLLVDADLRAPSVQRYFGFDCDQGLVDYLEGRKTVPELLIHPQGLHKLVILPGGKATDWASELIRSPRMMGLVQELKHYYPDRYVLFDLPPMLSYTDAAAFAPLVDGVILLVEARRTRREDLARCREMLGDLPVLGYIFNKASNYNEHRYYYPYYQGNGHSRRSSFWQWWKGKKKS